MTWKEKTVYRILLIVAKALAENLDLKADIQNLANHISAEWDRSKLNANISTN